MTGLALEIRAAFRSLVKRPVLSLAALVTLALAIGANTAVFSFVHAVLLTPPPYEDPDRLFTFFSTQRGAGGTPEEFGPSVPDVLDFQRDLHALAGVEAMEARPFNLSGTGDPERVDGGEATAGLFRLLGVVPEHGRLFVPEDAGTPVAVVSHAVWSRRFGGEAWSTGKSLVIDGVKHAIVGVLPPRFHYGAGAEVFVPLPANPAESDYPRGSRLLYATARLAPGATPADGQAEAERLAAELAQRLPETNLGWGAVLHPVRELQTKDVAPTLLMLWAAVAFVLLIACANVGGLLLTRALERRGEISVRAALGAGRVRLARPLVVESLLLSLAGGALGTGLAWAAVRGLRSVNPLHVQAPQDVGVNPGVLFAALGLSLVTGLALSAAPAFFASRAAAAEGLEDATRRSAGSVRSRALRSLLVVTEVASASILLFGAGITVKTLGKLLHVSPGFEARRAVTFEISFPDLRYPDHTARRRAMAALQERLSAIPGVAVASGTTQLPLQELTLITSFDVEEHPAATSAERESAHFARVLPGYLRALGTTLLAGRDFTVADDETAPFIAIVSDGFAKKYFPKESPIGKRIVRYPKGKKTPMTIVGIASDVREISLAKDAEPAIYVPALQQSREFLRLLVRANADATGALVPSIRSAVWSVDKDLPIAKLAALRALVDESVARPRFSAQLLGVLAAIGLFLAAIGVYALLATHVAQKTREIGIRMALGATASEVARSVVAEGGRLAAAGVLVGAGASLVLGRLVASLLYGVKPTDPVAFLAATSALVGTALVASWLPARRASRLDPAAALRAE